ncbi:MAG: glycosyltransferase family 2 protein [bacterium]
MKLSIVTTLYSSAPYIREFYERIRKSAEKITNDYELILVNDGATDDSLKIVLALYEKDKKIKIIDLSRNYGQHRAIMTGLFYAKGDLVFLIDSDLEEEPELLEKFHQEMFLDKEIDVVYGVRIAEKGSFFQGLNSRVFYWIFNRLSQNKIPENQMVARLMSRRYLKSVLSCKSSDPFLGGIFFQVGFKQKPVKARKLNKGSSTYSFMNRLRLGLNALIAFGHRLSTYIICFGLVIMVSALIIPIFRRNDKFIIFSIWLFSSMVLVILGVLCAYTYRIYEELRATPITVVKNIYE